MMDVSVLWKRLDRVAQERERERRRAQERDERIRRAEEKLKAIREFAHTIAEPGPKKWTP